MDSKKVLIIAGIAALFLGVSSVSAYYLYVLPKQNTERLQFEQQKWSQEQADKQKADQAKVSPETAAKAAGALYFQTNWQNCPGINGSAGQKDECLAAIAAATKEAHDEAYASTYQSKYSICLYN